MKIRNKNYVINSTLNKNIVLISDIHYSNKKDIKKKFKDFFYYIFFII